MQKSYMTYVSESKDLDHPLKLKIKRRCNFKKKNATTYWSRKIFILKMNLFR